jgi:diguanylate cyclase (GGDEF)-like protein/PAS domain S-box-containing protein
MQHNGILRIDADGQIVDANAAARIDFGLPQPLLLPTYIDSYVSADDAARFRWLRHRTVSLGRDHAAALKFRRLDGTGFLAYARFTPLVERSGVQGVNLHVDRAEPTELERDAVVRFFSLSRDPMLSFTYEGQLSMTNPAWRKLCPTPQHTTAPLLYAAIHPEDCDCFKHALRRCVTELTPLTLPLRVVGSGGQYRWMEWDVQYVEAEMFYYAVLHDVDEQRQQTRLLVQNEERLRILVDNINEYIYSVTYRNGTFVDTYHNRQALAVTGYSAEDFAADANLWYNMIYPDDRQMVVDNLEKIKSSRGAFFIEHRICRKDGSIHWITNNCVAVVNDYEGEHQYIGFILDITQQKDREEQLYQLATTDSLTGVVNRRTGLAMLDNCIKRAQRRGTSCLVCFVDINNLKGVNDRFGHREGDELIRTVARLVGAALRASDTLCRIGGDEYIVILDNTALEEGQILMHRVVRLFEEHNHSSNKSYAVSISYGFAEFRADCDLTVDDLLHIADARMYAHKQSFKHSERIGV